MNYQYTLNCILVHIREHVIYSHDFLKKKLIPLNEFPVSFVGSYFTYPLGWPVNLSHRIVTRFMDPQPWKWASSSSAVDP